MVSTVVDAVKDTGKWVGNAAKDTLDWTGDIAETGWKDLTGNKGENPYDKRVREMKESAANKKKAKDKERTDSINQYKAEKDASKRLASAKNKQNRKASGGRKATLLSDTLGGTNTDTETTLGKKSLLGL